MTLLAEAALPAGLFFRRTQRVTALLALPFHWLLGVAGFYGFSATMLALLPLFLVPVAAQAFSGYNGRVVFNRLALAGYLFLMLAAEIAFNVDSGWIARRLWLALPAIVAVLWWMNRGRVDGGDSPEPIWRLLSRPQPLYLVPLALFLNGASPFLGFKTEYSFAMYSNLRTEGSRTNHLVWKTPLRLADYQTDLVRVLEGSDRELLSRLGGRPVTRYELTSTLWDIVKEQKRGSIALVLDAGGERREYRAADSEPDLMVRPSYLERKLLRFRAIVPSERGKCAH